MVCNEIVRNIVPHSPGKCKVGFYLRGVSPEKIFALHMDGIISPGLMSYFCLVYMKMVYAAGEAYIRNELVYITEKYI